MPKITFEREVTEDQYKMLQAGALLSVHSIDDYVWAAIIAKMLNDLVNDPEGTSLSQKCEKMFINPECLKTSGNAAE